MKFILTDDVARFAEERARETGESPESEVSRWMLLGLAVEQTLLRGPDVTVPAGMRVQARPAPAGRAQIIRLLETVARIPDQSRVLARIRQSGKPVYGSDPDRPGYVVRIDPDGTRTSGKFVDREFVPTARALAGSEY